MLFIGQQYLVSVAVLNSIAFYGILFPSFIAYWFFNKASIRTVAWFPSTLHILCLLAYILLNATVLNYSHETLAKNACDVVATVVFFVSSLAYFRASTGTQHRSVLLSPGDNSVPIRRNLDGSVLHRIST